MVVEIDQLWHVLGIGKDTIKEPTSADVVWRTSRIERVVIEGESLSVKVKCVLSSVRLMAALKGRLILFAKRVIPLPPSFIVENL